ncbi:GNAT family N-acetyltransferase [Rhizobium sp. FKL33]|uniref:GNAT family N-acetyltransferase n=1 Tax=Rhizobium sp. FKL33 TaxID=2562307 RepID=UPI0010C12965|nr:GNAT family N-acetyltransferase [Rhizobium sp. FKL33]
MISSPSLLDDQHQIELFDCGQDSLNQWLRRRARANQASGASRTYVSCVQDRVIGYYCISSGGLALREAPGGLRRNMPDPVPMAILGRLAIDRTWQGKGLGAALLQDAVLRVRQAAHILGIRGVLVHAISPEAKVFYEHYGFVATATQPMTLVLSLKQFDHTPQG